MIISIFLFFRALCSTFNEEFKMYLDCIWLRREEPLIVSVNSGIISVILVNFIRGIFHYPLIILLPQFGHVCCMHGIPL